MREGLFDELLADDVRPNRLPDVDWLLEYRERGFPHGEPLVLSIGESWRGPPAALSDACGRAPSSAHGYQLSMYGLPRLRRALRSYLVREHRLGDLDDAEVAATWTGTRDAMWDFGRLVRERATATVPVAAVAAPAWDYAGVLEPLGFRVRYLSLRADRGFLPVAADLDGLLAELDAAPGERLELVVLNPQHNPTGRNWTAPLVRHALDVARDRRAAVLLDDAYYGMHDPHVRPTSALHEILAGRLTAPWLAVRSLGKQFDCNGWALGALVAPREVLDEIVLTLRPERVFNYGGLFQHAMAEWLEHPDQDAWVAKRNASLVAARQDVTTAVESHLRDTVPPAECGPYVLLPVPSSLEGRTRAFLEEMFRTTGLLLSDAWPLARNAPARAGNFVRMYLGAPADVLDDAVARYTSAYERAM